LAEAFDRGEDALVVKAIAEADRETEETWLQSDVYVGDGSSPFLTIIAAERHR
jgi:hypothetical protein